MIWINMVFMVWIWIDLDNFETEETKVKSNDESAIGVYQVYHWVYLYLGWSTEVADDDRSLRGLGLWSTPLINSKKTGGIFRSYQVLSKTSWFDLIFGRPMTKDLEAKKKCTCSVVQRWETVWLCGKPPLDEFTERLFFRPWLQVCICCTMYIHIYI